MSSTAEVKSLRRELSALKVQVAKITQATALLPRIKHKLTSVEVGADVTGGHAGDIALSDLSEKNVDSLTDTANYKRLTEAKDTKVAGMEAGADVTGAHQGDISLANLSEKSLTSLTDKSLANVDSGADTKLTGISAGADVTGDHQGDVNIDNIADGTSFKKFTSTEDTKLGGVEAGADVTGSHQGDVNIDNIAEGAAYKKYLADERTKMTGMEAGADVTGDHTAADISGQGDLATLDAVDTPQIVDRAVTIPTSAYTAAAQSVTTVVEHTVQTITFTSTGASIIIFFSALPKTVVNTEYVLYIYRETVKIFEHQGPTSSGYHPSFSVPLGDTPDAGSVTYYLKVKPLFEHANNEVYHCALLALEVKK